MSSPNQSASSNWSPQQSAAYAEAGEMLRHYSSVRMMVLSIALPVCIAILGWVVASLQQTRVVLYLLIAEGLLFLYAFAMSFFFSTKYEQTRQVLAHIEAGEDVRVYTNIVSYRLRERMHLDGIDKSLASVGVIAHLVFYAYCVLVIWVF